MKLCHIIRSSRVFVEAHCRSTVEELAYGSDGPVVLSVMASAVADTRSAVVVVVVEHPVQS